MSPEACLSQADTSPGTFQTQANSLIMGLDKVWSGAPLAVPRSLLVLSVFLLPLALLLLVLLPLVDREKSRVKW